MAVSLEDEQLDNFSSGMHPASEHARLYWRSLEERFATDDSVERFKREFPRHAAQLENALDRRAFLKLMGASLMLAGVTACGARQPVEKIVPYVRQPEEITLGQPLFYATAMTLGGYATGLLVESHEGRPTKVEGSPDHPASLGGTDAFAQASVLTVYDPDRAQTATHLGEISSWGEFLGEFRRALAKQRERQGAGLRILTETVTSPTLADQLGKLLKDFPKAVWHRYEPVNRDNMREGARLAFGEPVETIYHFDKAETVVALDADFLSCGPASLRYARDFITRRRVRSGKTEMNRLYAVECTPSNTGAMADHRLPVKAIEVKNLALRLADSLSVDTRAAAGAPAADTHADWIAALARDLQQHHGTSAIIAGDRQPPYVHALAHTMNQALGNVGNTISYTDLVEANPVNQLESLRQLVGGMDSGVVEMLVIIGGNPAYNTPSDLRFAQSMSKVALRVHLSLYYDETSALSHWHIPESHYLESWSDARAYDGTVTIIQPLIAPLYESKSAHELLAAFTDSPDRTGYDIVREFWRGKLGGETEAVNSVTTGSEAKRPNRPAQSVSPTQTLSANSADAFESAWQKTLHDGLVPNTALPLKSVSIQSGWSNQSSPAANPQPAANSSSLEIVFQPDPSVHDGRFANNGWLQELPKPLTKLTWDNAALVSPATARRLNLTEQLAGRGGEHGDIIVDVVELRYRGRALRAPVWITPGHADDSVTVQLGYGRTRAGSVGDGVGFNAYAIQTSDAPYFDGGLEVVKTGESYSLACTQKHHSMEGRDLVRSATIDEYRARPDFAKREADRPENDISLYPGWKYEGYAWGMAIDTGSCTGCNACVVACQAENNIPIVGKQEVMHGREMHWLRIDRYYAGDESNPQTLHQPVPCQHCENAPCELVCPVEATTHSSEGLNEMTYNRCVGTRYCSNNCPYKVRRFNFFQYANYDAPLVKLQRNPDVTVRSRGVMEKCTYCVQRIQHAKIESEREGRTVRDGEIKTACQQACPVEAIVFGNINDPESRVSQLKREPTNYGLLAELNTRPRTTYLATIRNPNPEIETE